MSSQNTQSLATHTLSLHDALPIYRSQRRLRQPRKVVKAHANNVPVRCDRERDKASLEERGIHDHRQLAGIPDRKSTRLNSSHVEISYAVFCLKKKNN